MAGRHSEGLSEALKSWGTSPSEGGVRPLPGRTDVQSFFPLDTRNLLACSPWASAYVGPRHGYPRSGSDQILFKKLIPDESLKQPCQLNVVHFSNSPCVSDPAGECRTGRGGTGLQTNAINPHQIHQDSKFLLVTWTGSTLPHVRASLIVKVSIA
jgi:hypothetical protein